MALDGPIPWIGDVLEIQTPKAVPNIRCLAQDLVGGKFHGTGIDAVAICCAVIFIHVQKEPEQFLFGLVLDVQYRGVEMLDEYLAHSNDMIASAHIVGPECGAMVRTGLERYAKLGLDDRQLFLKRLERCFSRYPFAKWNLDEEIIATEHGRSARLVGATLLGICTLGCLLAGYRSWLWTLPIAADMFLFFRPFKRRVVRLIHPADFMARIRERADMQHETLLQAQRLIKALEHDECWSQSWMRLRLSIEDHDVHWARLVGTVEASVGAKKERYQFTFPSDIWHDGEKKGQLENWRRALDTEMLAAEAELTRRFRAYGQRATVKERSLGIQDVVSRPYPGFMKIPAASQYLGLTQKKIRSEVVKGRVKYKMIGDLPHFTKEWLDEYLRTPTGAL